MAEDPIPLHSASALTPEEREQREAFERQIRELSEVEHRQSAEKDLEVWRGVAEQLLRMVESDLRHERRVRSSRISEHIGAVVEALRGSSPEAIIEATSALSAEVWGAEPEPDGPMSPALAQRRRRR